MARLQRLKNQPKIYAFDAGFVAYHRGWGSLRDEDRRQLLEHLVLHELVARFGLGRTHYWRNKQRLEVDFILKINRRQQVIAIECTSSAQKFDAAGIKAFRRKHPVGRNIVVTLKDVDAYRQRFGDLEVEMVPYLKFARLLDELQKF